MVTFHPGKGPGTRSPVSIRRTRGSEEAGVWAYGGVGDLCKGLA
jgi:hypothetical protein